MIVGLMGFEFESSNKGCEALTYSLFPILEKKSEIDTIVVFNIHESLGHIPEKYPQYEFVNISIKMKKPQFWREFLAAVKRCDVVLDITHGDSFSDIYGWRWFAKTTFLKQLVECMHCPLILLPQTYGPYKSGFAEKWAAKIIRDAYRVYTRDRKSKEAVESQIGTEVEIVNTADLAFSLPYSKVCLEAEKIKIGINVSGLLWNYRNIPDHNIVLKVDYKSYVHSLIQRLYADPKYQIYLIPHVICDDREGKDFYDNDCKPCEELKKEYPNCIYSTAFDTVLDVKNYISALDALVAARMHASIGALSSGVCSIPFAYSRKFSGVYGDIDYPYLIDGQVLSTDEAVELTMSYIKDYETIKETARKAMNVVKREHKLFEADFLHTLEAIHNERNP